MQLSLADRTILVTGGGSGIGKGVATAVVSAGGNAMLVGRNADRLVAAADEIRSAAGDGAGEVRYEPADVTNEDEVSAVVQATTAWHGRLNGVVHCAGGSETIGPITQLDSEAWRRAIDLNVTGSHVRPQAQRRVNWCAAAAARSSGSRRSRRATRTGGSARMAFPSPRWIT